MEGGNVAGRLREQCILYRRGAVGRVIRYKKIALKILSSGATVLPASREDGEPPYLALLLFHIGITIAAPRLDPSSPDTPTAPDLSFTSAFSEGIFTTKLTVLPSIFESWVQSQEVTISH